MSTTTLPTTTTVTVADPKSKRRSAADGGGRKCGKNIVSLLLMMAVVSVVYWEETGLKTLFDEDEGPSELIWKPEGKSLLWGGTSVLHAGVGRDCHWITYKSVEDPSKTAQLCLPAGDYQDHKDDYISNALEANAYVSERQILHALWNPKHDKKVYLEIGSHVGGGGVLELLLNDKNALIVAVEPHPVNLFCLTSTLLALPPEYNALGRVSVLPLALGRESSIAAAAVARLEGNVGSKHNAVRMMDETQTTAGDGGAAVILKKLDDLIEPGGVQLVNLNVNGYECRVLEGGVKALRKVPTIAFFMNPEGLEHYGCSKTSFLAKLKAVAGSTSDAKWYRHTGRFRAIPNKDDDRQGFMGVAKKQW